MSTRFTKKNTPMVESKTLQLLLTASKIQDLTNIYLCKELTAKGFNNVTPSILNFLSELECGVNYASEIARKLDVSRQMVAKTVKQLSTMEYLEQVEGVGKQKEILFTHKGELLISTARQLLAGIDQSLNKAIGENLIDESILNLNKIQKVIPQL